MDLPKENKEIKSIQSVHMNVYRSNIWDRVFKNGPTKIYGRQPLKIFKGFKFFKGCLPQIFTLSILEYFSYENNLPVALPLKRENRYYSLAFICEIFSRLEKYIAYTYTCWLYYKTSCTVHLGLLWAYTNLIVTVKMLV